MVELGYGFIAKAITRCTSCGEYYAKGLTSCAKCQLPLEDIVVVNATELNRLIHKLSTPEGIVKLLNSFKDWTEERRETGSILVNCTKNK